MFGCMIMAQGKLKKWNDEKGFGFITPDDGSEEIFVHISAFKNSQRRPLVGDIITYDPIHSDGKLKAIRAKIKGLDNHESDRKKQEKKPASSNIIGHLVSILIFLGLGFIGYTFFFKNDSHSLVDNVASHVNEEPVSNTPVVVNKPSIEYHCDGRTHCSQMTSKQEAIYFIKHCPNTQMDGDHDGNPCESQFQN